MNEWSAGWNEGNGEKKSKAAQTKVMKREREREQFGLAAEWMG